MLHFAHAMARRRVTSGPHPENQIKRVEVRRPRHALLAMLVSMSAAALIGLGMGRVGLVLALIVAVTQGGAAIVLVAHRKLGRHAALAAALIAIVWGAATIAVVNVATWLSGGMVALGVFETMLVAGSTPRKNPGRKRRPRGGA